MDYKQCSKCKKYKLLENFNKCSATLIGRDSYCKPCKKIWRNENKDRISKYKRAWRLTNAKHVKNYQKQYVRKYFKENPEIRSSNMRKYRKKESFKAYNREYQRKRLENPVFRLQNRLRSRVSVRLKKLGISKLGSTIKDLGCTLEQLKNHLESLFVPNMTWENYGKWHVDHIIPLASFNLNNEEEFKKAVHFTNLQPLWAVDNYRKGMKKARGAYGSPA